MTDRVFFFQLNVTPRRSVPVLGLNHWTPLIKNTRNKIENYSYHNHTTILHVCTYLHTYLSELKFRDTVLPLTECCFRIGNFGRGGPNGLKWTQPNSLLLLLRATLTYTLH
jgi:hypothetical protein